MTVKDTEFIKLYNENVELKKNKTDLENDCKKLQNDINDLNESNKELKKILGSKRYKLVDFVVDTTYSALNKKNKKQKILLEKEKVPLKKVDITNNKKEEKRERKINKGQVDIININFYDWDGKVVYKGGAERYVYDLACLLKKMGYKPRILQCSNVPFKKKFKQIEVVGVGAGDRYDMRKNSEIFGYFCENSELVIASPCKLACNIKDIPVIGINHGVDFDFAWNHYGSNYTERDRELIDSLRNVKSCVCVDTNFINWTRTIDYALTMKEKYIPNYCNLDDFNNSDRKKWGRDDGKIIFVYPRRINEARGSDITARAFERILPKYQDKIIINFVGQIETDDARKRIGKLMDKYPESVFHYECEMKDMVDMYKNADVALIPTRYCEGTSLSCIEAMAMGCVVVTTNVGGLPNLVIDGYNGRMISPNTEELAKTIEEIINTPAIYQKMAKNGFNVAKEAFSKEIWEKRWEKEIQSVIDGLRVN